jgi:LemA protein
VETGFDLAGWGPLLLKVGGAAVLLFWIVGAYNRLVRLRGAMGGAWAQIDELLARRSFLLEALADAVREPLADEAMTLTALSQADQRQRGAALAVRARPSHSPALVAWVLAEAELASPMARLQALIEQRHELASSEPVLPLQRQLRELSPRLVYARQLFSDAAEAYNAVLEEFPTRAVGRLFGMRPASRL